MLRLDQHGRIATRPGWYALPLALKTGKYVPVGRYRFTLGRGTPPDSHEIHGLLPPETVRRLQAGQRTNHQVTNPRADPPAQRERMRNDLLSSGKRFTPLGTIAAVTITVDADEPMARTRDSR